MSLFTSLYPLAQNASLTILIVAEGDQLRVNVMPKSKDEKAEQTLYPLSLLASPEELDRDFAEAVQIYAPGSQSVLEQARAASAANADTDAPRALPAPAKGKPGRKPKTQTAPAPSGGDSQAANAGATDEGDPEVDPRQTSLLESAANEAAAAQTADSDAPPAAATSEDTAAAAGDEGLDLL
ncbi:PRTRC system E domain protein [Burkholderia cepacia]|jgi:PRTRC genetic system protein E|uniref:PRTRC system protein E n=1 Tax=Burkholderia cenocepacia TaxID=95486 RepID=UPI0004F5B4EC|nr:PRTRC system protein E [Burkholderia cenocepacia]AIO45105.1 PRTRC system E domain protein [Burkholderia cepacia]KGC00305.1 PRTRC system E domain protein [Burkholderia cepacia]MDN7662700.1 PRTRC system protein E [Burkholderia cenocepacia]